MLVMFIALLVAAFILLSLRFPAVWSALMAIDEPSDPRELGLVVASRTCCRFFFPLRFVSFHSTHTLFFLPLNPTKSAREPFPRKWPSGMHGQAHHDASQSTLPSSIPFFSRVLCCVNSHAPLPCPHHIHPSLALSLKLNQVNTRRRRTTTLAQRNPPRQFALPTPRQRPPPAWIRIPKHFGMQHH